MASDMSTDQPQAPRNCISCKERKVRCDRRRPCSNCTKANRQCVFPTTGRILRQPERMRRETLVPSAREIDLMARIRRLENVVSHLHAKTNTRQSEQHEDLAGSEISPSDDMDEVEDASSVVGSSSATRWSRSKSPRNLSAVGVMVGEEPGRLYVGDGFWADLQQELDAIKKTTNRVDYEDDDVESLYTQSLQSSHRTFSTSGPSFIFSSQSSSMASTEDLRPLPSQMLFIWRTYVENIDPFIKVLHIPTVSKMIHDSRGNFDLLPSFMEPLMFSIAFAAVMSLTSEEVQVHFRSDKKDLVSQFRLGTEDSLSRADFINTKELSVVQSLLIYTLVIRLEESQRFVWALTGLITRIAVAIGIQRDGSHFPDITPFEAEMRRRAWCYICILDFATGDFQVPEMSISDASFDTQLPSNLNDDEIHPDMSALPEAGNGHTDMTICLLRCKIWRVGKHIKKATAAMYPCSQEPDADILHQLAQLSQFSQKEFSEFLVPTQPDKPIYQFTRTMAAVAIRRYELILQHIKQPSLQRSKSHLDLDKQFLSALEILEDIHTLQHSPSTKHWAWQLYGFVQWQPLALVLSRLSVCEFDGMAERSWEVITRTLEGFPESIRQEPLWKPLFNLIQSVKRRRLQQLKNRPVTSTRGEHHALTELATPFKTIQGELNGSEGRTHSPLTANALSGSERAHSPSALSETRQPSLGWRSQGWFLTRDDNSSASVGDMDAISSFYRREEDHLPVELPSIQESLPTAKGQDVAEGSFQYVGEPGWDQWNNMINVSGQSMLWDRWAF